MTRKAGISVGGQSTTTVLDLNQLREGIPALTRALGEVHAECAAVCLDENGHGEVVSLHVRDHTGVQFELTRSLVTETMRRAHYDKQKATELGACGVALLLTRELTGLTAIQQSRKGPGFDYWLGPEPPSADALPFQHSARLEVSGILNGTESQFRARVKKKLAQSEPSDDTGFPAIAAVVEFGKPQAEVKQRP